jgi:hypothetical protein
MESITHSRHVRVIRGRGLLGSGLSIFDIATGLPYTAGVLATRIGTYNSDIEGGYVTNPINYTDIPVDRYGLLQDDPTRTHIVPFADFARYPDAGPLAGPGQGNLKDGGSDPYFTALSRPVASYVLWRPNDVDGFPQDRLTIQAVRISSTARNFIVVRMKFVYDVFTYYDFTNHYWPAAFSDFSLFTSGTNGVGKGFIGRNGYIEIPLPVPDYADPSDAPEDSTGWAHVPFFDITWDEFQARVGI